MIWVGIVLWHIDYCRLFNAKSFLQILSTNKKLTAPYLFRFIINK